MCTLFLLTYSLLSTRSFLDLSGMGELFMLELPVDGAVNLLFGVNLPFTLSRSNVRRIFAGLGIGEGQTGTKSSVSIFLH